jgi:hypothetical protein
VVMSPRVFYILLGQLLCASRNHWHWCKLVDQGILFSVIGSVALCYQLSRNSSC